MSHNFYLYNDPTTGQLTWIPWDNNEALSGGGGGGFGRRGGNGALDLASVRDDWPLIRFLMDDPEYQALYVSYVEATVNGAFAPEQMTARYQALHDLVAPLMCWAPARSTVIRSCQSRRKRSIVASRL